MLDADEPETMLTLFRHVAERKAWTATRGHIDRDDANTWMRLADALRAAEDRLKDAA